MFKCYNSILIKLILVLYILNDKMNHKVGRMGAKPDEGSRDRDRLKYCFLYLLTLLKVEVCMCMCVYV